MDCDWIFLGFDHSRVTATIKESTTPVSGDGKWHNGKGYAVAVVITDRLPPANTTIIAVEHA